MSSNGFPELAAVTVRTLVISGLVLLAACTAGTRMSSSTPSVDMASWQLPAELAPRLRGLDTPQQTFITSGEFLTYMPARQMELELATRDTARILSKLA